MVVREGPSIYYYSEGHREESTFKNGVSEGPFVLYYSDGERIEGTYKNGVKEGRYVYYFSDGTREEGTYNNGSKVFLKNLINLPSTPTQNSDTLQLHSDLKPFFFSLIF